MVPSHLPYFTPKPSPDNALFKVSYCVEQRTVMKNSNQSHFQMSETRYASSNMKKSLNIKPFNNFYEV